MENNNPKSVRFLGPGPDDTFRFDVDGTEELVPRNMMGAISEQSKRRNEFIRKASIAVLNGNLSNYQNPNDEMAEEAVKMSEALANELIKKGYL